MAGYDWYALSEIECSCSNSSFYLQLIELGVSCLSPILAKPAGQMLIYSVLPLVKLAIVIIAQVIVWLIGYGLKKCRRVSLPSRSFHFFHTDNFSSSQMWKKITWTMICFYERREKLRLRPLQFKLSSQFCSPSSKYFTLGYYWTPFLYSIAWVMAQSALYE